MRQVVFSTAAPAFCWVDVVNPDATELAALATEFGLPETAVQDCLDPKHLPKVERHGDRYFLIVRAFDEQSDDRAVSTLDLTRKVALFFGPDFLLSIHRRDQAFLASLREWYAKDGPGLAQPLGWVLTDLLKDVVMSYVAPLEEVEKEIEAYEAGLFRHRRRVMTMEDAFILKRRAGLMTRMLLRLREMMQHLPPTSDQAATLFQDVREAADAVYFRGDDLVRHMEHLLALELGIEAQRTNDVIRILTLFSAVFMPLTFIVGIYGMNFAYMPELTSRWGYPAVWTVMGLVTVGIFLWFRRSGWLR